MPIQSYTLNGVPVEDYGLYVIRTEGPLYIPRRAFKMVDLVLRDGQRAVSEASMTEPRVIQLGLRIEPSSLLDRRTKLNALFRDLQGMIEIATIEDPSKVCYGLVQEAQTAHFGGRPFAVLPVECALLLLCPDPLYYDVDPVQVAITAVNTPVAIPMGNASARTRRLRIRFNGSFTSPITAILKHNGVELARMTIATATTSSEYLDSDHDAFTITKYAGATDVTGTLDVTHDFFALDALDGLTLQIDKGTADLEFYRAYVS